MKSANNTLAFIFGVAVGSAVTWKYLKAKYEQIAQEEIESVKETFSYKTMAQTYDKADEATERETESAAKRPTPAKREYVNYSTPDKPDEEEAAQNDEETERPYVIAPEEFGEIDGYQKISVNYFSDQVLADDNDDLIEDVEGTVGFDSLNHFGEYEDDSVFVRNDRLRCDYEILLDRRTYSDITGRKPHEVTD